MDWNVHHRLAQLALQSRLLDFDEVSSILTELGRRAAAGRCVSLPVWIDEGWLTTEQLTGLLDKIDGAPSVEEFLEQKTERVAIPEMSKAPDHLDDGDTEPMDSGSFDLAHEPSESTEADEVAPDEDGAAKLSEGDLGVARTWQGEGQAIEFAETGIFRAGLADPESEDLPALSERYRLGEELGRGGGGLVVRAFDSQLKRDVAMKIFSPPGDTEAAERERRRFLAEAQAACQLEHPNIMPVYDAGSLRDGRVFFTMLLVREHSLADVIAGLKRQDRPVIKEYTLSRLLVILQQVAQAMHYAHSRGVIHRDLKPGNIMLGEFGEVLVMDWGLAQVRGDSVSTEMSEIGEEIVEQGQTLGTPAYMPPEQARGRLELVDERSDVYALGAILYEMLTLYTPFEKDSAVETMWSVIDSALIRPGERSDHGMWEVPGDLERICLKALAYERDERYATAGALYEDLERYTSGIRPRKAEQRLKEGRRAVDRYLEAKGRIAELNREIDKVADAIAPWEPIDRKRRLWALEDEREQLRLECARVFGGAVTGFQRALAHDPDTEAARHELAELYWERYCEAEAVGDDFEEIYFRALIEETDRPRFVRRLSTEVDFRLKTRPSGATVTLFPVEELDRRLMVTDELQLGTTPLHVGKLEVGSYLLALQATGRAVVRAPLFARRGEAVDLRISLPATATMDPDFVFIPGGPCFVGGDSQAMSPRPLKKIEVASFYCARMPVTFREYLAFLDAQPLKDARAHAPARHDGSGRGLLVVYDERSGRWHPAPYYSDLPAERQQMSDRDPRWNLPVVGVSGDDGRAYCRWKSHRDGRNYRLPTQREWEKAGRGVDGRDFPWGSHFDATFCKRKDSRAHLSRLEPVGEFVDDVSPYGVRDLAGGVSEWCLSVEGHAELLMICGGAWNMGPRASRLASVRRQTTSKRSRSVGFRLVYDVEFDDGWTGTRRVRIDDDL